MGCVYGLLPTITLADVTLLGPPAWLTSHSLAHILLRSNSVADLLLQEHLHAVGHIRCVCIQSWPALIIRLDYLPAQLLKPVIICLDNLPARPLKTPSAHLT